MPCCYSTFLGECAQLALWRIEESVEELKKMCSTEWQKDLFSHPRRQSEQLASRLLLQRLSVELGQSVTGLSKTSQGAPSLVGSSYYCSISHDWPYASAILHKDQSVGIDVAALTSQALQVREKFLSKYELIYCQDEAQATLYWAAKEAVYKYTGGKVKDFKQIRILTTNELQNKSQLQNKGRLQIHLGEEILNLGYFWLRTHVVAYLPLEGEVPTTSLE